MQSAAESQIRQGTLLQALRAILLDRARLRRPLAVLRGLALGSSALAGVTALLFAAALLSAQRAELKELRAMARVASGGATDAQSRFINVMRFVYVDLRQRDTSERIDRNAWARKPAGLLGAVVGASPAVSRFVKSFYEPGYVSFLKPSAVQIFVQRSDCAGASRLMVLLLDQLGIDAFKLGIHDAAGTPVHAVVSGNVDGRWVVADPLHGYVYPLEDGRLATAQDIARRPELATRFLKPKENPVIAEYRYVRSFNWNKIPVLMPLAYEALHATIGDRADRIGRPHITEMPKALSAIFFAAIGLLLLLPALALGLPKRVRRLRVPRRSATIHRPSLARVAVRRRI